MRLLLLLFVASIAQATSVTVPITVTVNDQNCTAWTVAGTTITCTSSGPTLPPTQFCVGYQAVNMGVLQTDGHTVNSGPLGAQGIAYWKLQIPNPLPAGTQGYKTSIRTSSIARDAYRKAYLTKDKPCDFTVTAPNLSQGVSTSNSVIVGAAGDRYRVSLQAGEIWYFTVVQENLPDDGFYYAAYFPF